MKKKLLLIYILLFLGVAALPFYGMLFYKNDETIGNEEEVETPSLTDGDGFNVSILSDLGSWFEKKMAFRDVMISAQTRISSDIFHESANDQVIVGSDGWLYYADSLDDYQGVNLLSDRALYNIAYNLYRMQEYTKSQGGTFVFTVAPNKNSLYPEYMPYYNRAKYSEEKNIDNLLPYLEDLGVNYADLFSLFEAQDEVLYHATDSHWNNKGAALAYDSILTAAGKSHETYDDVAYTEKEDFIGDLEEMLHPRDPQPETEVYYEKEYSYTYTNDVESTFDPLIYTENETQEGSLLMYRDSFGNALVPFFAEAFQTSEFSRAEPYFFSGDYEAQSADTVVVERAERFLHNLAENPAVIEASRTMLDQGYETADNETTLTIGEAADPYQTLEGVLDPTLVDNETKIYLRIDGAYAYEASPMTTEDGNDYGYRCYLTEEQLPSDGAKVEVLAVKDSATYILGRYQVSLKEQSVADAALEEDDYTVDESDGYTELGRDKKGTATYHIFNRTGKTIVALYTAKADADSYGENLLGDKEEIADGEEFLLHCKKLTKKEKKSDDTYWIKVKYSDGKTGEFKNMPLGDVTYFDLYQSGTKYSYIKYQNDTTRRITSNKSAVKKRVAAEEEAARKAKEEAERKAKEEAKKKAAAAAKAKQKSSSSSSGGKRVVRKEKVYDCDGSGNYYYIYHYSDGSTSTG